MGPRMRRRYRWLSLLRSFEHPAAQWMRWTKRYAGRAAWIAYTRRKHPRSVPDWEVT